MIFILINFEKSTMILIEECRQDNQIQLRRVCSNVVAVLERR